MSEIAYKLPEPWIVSHASFDLPAWLADGDFVKEDKKVENGWGRELTSDDALAASGDCFVTIATRLDKLSQNMPTDSVEQIEIEHVVSSLLYLQDHYAVIGKHKLNSNR
jgi:hypothetical protein